MKQIKLKNMIVLQEASSNVITEAAVPAIDKKKITDIANMLVDENMFPELDGESLSGKSLKSFKDTIDVITTLPKVLGDQKKWSAYFEKVILKYGSDQVIWMSAENAENIEDPKLNTAFTGLDEALRDLRACFADFEPYKEMVASYTRLAEAIDKVLAATRKIKAGAGKKSSNAGAMSPSELFRSANHWLTEKDADAEVNKAKSSLVAWAKTNGIVGSQLGLLDMYVLELCQAYAENQ